MLDNKNYQWLYSSGVNNNTWWAYDDKSNDTLELLYKKFNSPKQSNNSGLNIPTDQEEEEPSYTIPIGYSSYRIDFESMRQINTLDENKKRKILRVDTSGSDDLTNFLKNNKVVGVAGTKF